MTISRASMVTVRYNLNWIVPQKHWYHVIPTQTEYANNSVNAKSIILARTFFQMFLDHFLESNSFSVNTSSLCETEQLRDTDKAICKSSLKLFCNDNWCNQNQMESLFETNDEVKAYR